MANGERGEVGFEIGGASYRLKMSVNAVCEIEDASGRSVNEFATALSDTSRFRLSDMRLMFWACMRAGGSDISRDAAGDLIDEIGFERVGLLLEQAFSRAFPEAANSGGKGAAAP